MTRFEFSLFPDSPSRTEPVQLQMVHRGGGLLLMGTEPGQEPELM